MRPVFVSLIMALSCLVANGQEWTQTVEYVQTTEQVCEGGVCRLVLVNRPVVRMVRNTVAAVASVASDLASAAPSMLADCPCGPDCACGTVQSTAYTATEIEVMSVVGYQNIQMVGGMSLAERIQTRRQARRAGRMVNAVNFAATGVNRRLLNVSNFFPRAWFNLR